MVFDPRKIKERKILPKDLPEDASRSQRILALANQLHERGLTASVADAKRLAEGMVDVEHKVITESRGKSGGEDIQATRQSLQSGGNAIFDAVLGTRGTQLALPEDFQRFVDRSRTMHSKSPQQQTVFTKQKTPPNVRGKDQILFAEAPPHLRSPKESEYVTISKPPKDAGVADISVQESEDGVVISHTESTPTETITEEVGFIKDSGQTEEIVPSSTPSSPQSQTDPAPAAKAPTQAPPMHGGGSDPAKEQGIDLANIFYAGNGKPSSPPPIPTQPMPEVPKEQDPTPQRKKQEDPGKAAGIDLANIFYTGSDKN